jgi:hypothetical protein
MGVRVAWIVYRGNGDRVRFTPEEFKPNLDFSEEGANSP